MRWVRPDFTRPANSVALASSEVASTSIAGSRSPVTASDAATWIAVGKVSLEDWRGVDVVVGVHLDAGPSQPARRSPRWRSCWSWSRSRSGRRRSGMRRRARRRRPPGPRVSMAAAGSASSDAERAVDLGRGRLDLADGVDQRRLDRRTADREVLDRPLGLRPPQGLARHLDLAHRVVLGAEVLITHDLNVPTDPGETALPLGPGSVRLVAWTSSRCGHRSHSGSRADRW